MKKAIFESSRLKLKKLGCATLRKKVKKLDCFDECTSKAKSVATNFSGSTFVPNRKKNFGIAMHLITDFFHVKNISLS